MQRLRLCFEVDVPIIRSYGHREGWQDKFDAETTTVAIYNSGRHLYFDPLFQDATTHYDARKWCWLPFREFCEPVFVMANKYCIPGFGNGTTGDTVVLQHLGHTTCGIAEIRVSSGPNHWVARRSILIPRLHIQYLAVRKGIIIGRTCVQQPLPFKALKTVPALQPLAPWSNDARWKLRF